MQCNKENCPDRYKLDRHSHPKDCVWKQTCDSKEEAIRVANKQRTNQR